MSNIWAVNSLGGFLANTDFSERVRHAAQPMQLFRNFVNNEPEEGEAGHGDTLLFDKMRNITTAGSSLSETATIPKSNMVIVQDQLVVTEYGNSIPYTEKLESLSRITVPRMVETALTNDMAKTLDSQAAAQFQASSWKAVCTTTAATTLTTDSTPAAAAGANMSDKNVRDIVDEMKKNNVPRFADGLYRCIASTNSIRGLFDFFESKANLSTLGVARSGVVGEYYGCLFMEETNVLSNTIGTGSVFGEAVFFGEDAVRERIVTPENIRIKIPTDYGRDQGIAWYAMTGFKLTWDWSGGAGQDTEAHVVHVTST